MENLVIEQGVAMPTTSRGTTGNSRQDKFNRIVKPMLDKMDQKGQSFFLPNYDNKKADSFRRDTVFDTNKVAKELGKSFRIAPATKTSAEAVLDDKGKQVMNDDGTPKVKATIEHGLRVWLVETGLPIGEEANKANEKAVEVKPTENGEAPEVNA